MNQCLHRVGDLQYGPGNLLTIEGEVVESVEAGEDQLTVEDQKQLHHPLVDIRWSPGESGLIVQAPG